MNDSADSVRMIRDSVRAVAPPGAGLGRIRALRSDPAGIDRAIWRQVTEMGWLSLLIDEDQGGLGLGLRELAAIGEELGAALVPEPVIAVAAIAPLLVGDARLRLLGGSMIVVPAWREDIASLGAQPRTILSGGRVTGTKILVASAAAADGFVVSTTSGAVLVERGATGVTLDLKRTHDGGHRGTLTLADAPCIQLAGDLTAALELLSLAHAAYLLGAAERAFAMMLEYLSLRRQFGKLIGAFQTLQHRAVEAKIQLALSRAVLDEAITDIERNAPPAEQLRSRARAIARMSDTAMLVAREAIQMHGAIGITDDHDIGLYCRKILATYNQFGTAGANRARFMANRQAEPAA